MSQIEIQHNQDSRLTFLLLKHMPRLNPSGFTLVEVMVSLVILIAIMAGLVPVFMSYTLTTINNDVKTGAIALSQQILDELRQDKNIESWPNSGTSNTTPQGTSLNNKIYGNKTYNLQLAYCSTNTYCNDSSRQVKLEVSHNGRSIYTIETVYTELAE